MKNVKTRGFTLVELLMAMAFFSFILLFILTGFMIVSRAYSKGITVKLIQDENRRLTEKFTREIRTASSIDSQPDCLALDNTIYYWSVPVDNTHPSTSPKLLLSERDTTCADREDDPSASGVQSVLNDRVGVQSIEVNQLGGRLYKLHIVLSTTDVDLISGTGDSATCDVTTGDQYCDIVSSTTMVSTR